MIIAKAIQQERMDLCLTCDEYFAMTKMCRKCGCLIPAKVKFAAAKCPLHKWEKKRIAVHQEKLKNNG